MASTINASSTANGIVSTADASGILNIQSNGVNTNAQAWVNFNGSTAVIRASYNVSSVTRTSSGYYTINMTNALADANYAVSMSASSVTSVGAATAPQLFSNSSQTTAAPTSSSFTVYFSVWNFSANIDPTYICASVFR